MYINIHKDVRCSECNSLNNYETVTRSSYSGTTTFKRCLKCGHEKIESTTTSSQNILNSQPICYTLPKPDKETKF